VPSTRSFSRRWSSRSPTIAVRDLERRFGTQGSDDAIESEVPAAGLKAYASTHCTETLQACREACGGQGYVAENRFAALKADTDVFTTFEGANQVLYQLVAKGLLSRFREEMGELTLWRALQYLGERAETSLTELNPVITRRTEEDHLLDADFHLAALSYREDRLLRSVAMRMRARLSDGMDSFQAVMEVQDHLVALSRAHVERLMLERFQDACAAPESTEASEVLTLVCSLFGLSRIEADRGWFLECGYIEANKSRAIRTRVNALCREVSGCAEDLVASFGIPEALLPELVQHPSG
jgi:acyl-CoA oxidase